MVDTYMVKTLFYKSLYSWSATFYSGDPIEKNKDVSEMKENQNPLGLLAKVKDVKKQDWFYEAIEGIKCP